MQNWSIAILEHFGLLTRQEAEHIANEIKTSIGSETYKETYEIVKNIISKGDFKKRALLPDLEADVKELQTRIEKLDKNSIAKPHKAM